MTITELIKQLEKLRNDHGDIECYTTWGEPSEGWIQDVNFVEVCKNHNRLGTYLMISTEGEDRYLRS